MIEREELYNQDIKETPDGEKLYRVWARVGMTGYLTKEELKIINRNNKEPSDFEELNDIFERAFFRDGNTYFPEEDEGNKIHIDEKWY